MNLHGTVLHLNATVVEQLPYIEDFGGNNPLQLANGNYTYTVTDDNGCTVTE